MIQNLGKVKFGMGVGVALILVITCLVFLFGGEKEKSNVVDVTTYELPAALQDYFKANSKIHNSYISGTKIYTATEQKIKNATVYTYYVLHLLLPEEGLYYDIEDGTGTELAHFEGDSEDYLYNTEELYYPQMVQLVQDKNGDFSVYTY